MDKSRLIAGLVGPTLAALGLSVLINHAVFVQIAFTLPGSYFLLIVSGVLALLAGLAIVITHNVWKGWPVVLTVFGWLAVAGGLARILLPRQIADIAPQIVGAANGSVYSTAGALLALIGLLLTWKAFSKG